MKQHFKRIKRLIAWRRQYLRQIRKFCEEEQNIFYLNEAWVNTGHTNNKVWQDMTITNQRQAFLEGLSTVLKNPTGKGKRLIICHIGLENGFIEGDLLIFEGNKDGDYHDEVDSHRFESWKNHKECIHCSRQCVIPQQEIKCPVNIKLQKGGPTRILVN
ncbi:hypothetical protein ILUMI_08305 [Ignelater luminosus]|uniref:Uncharacterized protein n=1 Tax=Ignelater luminosus TaxID=2038154 RepID=A0A8K0GFI9_IGNLU|nr:hypothetical protein ILUMI_08305 [Ignelater luminosus]